ncbi:MAG TPA: helix-turn-helix transcriptional regulator [Gemmatimonadaceae bacterium]|nr:helix-turn-helix transcriptional regulator [Gemmatimonadaceae bacterium]
MLMHARADVLAKIAAGTAAAVRDRQRRGAPGKATATTLARGNGWSVSDVVCTCGPGDRVFEEAHTQQSIGVVLSGTFQYRSRAGRHVMSAGSLLLGNPGDSFECDHDHAVGDRCVAFHYSPAYLEQIAAELGRTRIRAGFGATRLPPARQLSGAVARTAVALGNPEHAAWGELAVHVAAAALSFEHGRPTARGAPPAAVVRRVTEQIRAMELDPSMDASLDALAAAAGLSPFAYLRAFEHLTGATPHQMLLRARLRRAAVRLETETSKVIDVALSSGFGDVSNFNKAFRAEFGATPTAYRRSLTRA